MIETADIYRCIEAYFEFVLAVDDEERVCYTSPFLQRTGSDQAVVLVGKRLEDVLAPASLRSFRAGMAQAREGHRAFVLYTPRAFLSTSIPLKVGHLENEDGHVFVLFGSQLDQLGTLEEWEKHERAKELACIYAVADWIEVSRSVREFFERLPELLSRGFCYPEAIVVWSLYGGETYGEPITSEHAVSTRLVVHRQPSGEIRVAYRDDAHALLPEEQKMLSEIGRMLSLALERKELRERLTLKQAEEADYSQRIADLEQEIAQRELELEDQHQRLATVNSYLERTNRSWEESRTILETVFAGMPDDAALIDRNRNVVMASHREVAAGSRCYDVFFGRSTPCPDCRLARIVQEKAPVTLTIEHEDRVLEVHALPVFSKEHEVDGILEYYRDVTREKMYERQIRQADQLASLGQLVSGIGHEINNPNQFIRGNVKIIRQALEDLLPIVDAWHAEHPDFKVARLPYPFFRKHIMTLVDDMAHGSERIKSIVEGLKRFARRDEGLLIDTVEINTLVEACTRLVHNEIHKHAEIVLDLSPDVPTFTGNAQKIEQVVVNLLVNASQAMPEDRRGRITVRTRAEDGNVVVEVEDDGKGMNESTLKQIFDPFFTTKRAKGGTGLGLAIAYRIVEEHRGHIAVRSAPGVGTTFTLCIPVGRPPAPDA
ncbi:MAG: PAS domain-containing protein [Deltaproteobacteria bacterium]|nr:PAS domain-containing protein [Deltaproteobacteria bacterium]